MRLDAQEHDVIRLQINLGRIADTVEPGDPVLLRRKPKTNVFLNRLELRPTGDAHDVIACQRQSRSQGSTNGTYANYDYPHALGAIDFIL